jgi:tetratricopeptide (TPR) repeat protein
MTVARSLALVALLLGSGCAPRAARRDATARTRPTTAAAAPILHTDDEFARARADYDAEPLDASDRPSRRASLERYALQQVAHALDGAHLEDAFEQLKQVLTLYDPIELRAQLADAPLLDAVERVERAFRRRGAHQEVLVALAVQIQLADAAARARADERYRQVSDWMLAGSGGERPEGGTTDGRERLIEDLEAAARLWPSPFVVERLTALYFQRPGNETAPAGARRGRRGLDLRELVAGAQQPGSAYDLARLYLRASRLDEALAQVRKLPADGPTEKVRTLLEKVTAPAAQPGDVVTLAMLFAQSGRDDRDVAERVCSDGARRFPQATEPRLCAGRLALSLEQLGIALKNFVEAWRLELTRRETWDALAQVYHAHLFQLASDENLNVAELEKELGRVEAFHAEAAKRFPQKPLQPSMVGALFEVGRGYYNGGRLADARRYLERSIALEPSAPALELIGQIRLKKGEGREAAALFERAASLPKHDRGDQYYWRAKLRRQLGDAFEVAGDAAGAEAARKAALADWDVLLGFPLPSEISAEAAMEKGKLLYQLGDRDAALEWFEKAIDALPERGSTYADAIAFLVSRGELEEALDAYHRALGRSEVTDYLKVYCSLWVIDLARRAGQPEDPLASAFLASTDGAKWFDDLARWATRREAEATLLERADSPAKKAESAFYRAMRAEGAGRHDEARALWKQVLESDMMAFFEYDMAALYLKLGGAPAAPVVKATRPAGEPRSTPRGSPDGSI